MDSCGAYREEIFDIRQRNLLLEQIILVEEQDLKKKEIKNKVSYT